MQTVSTTRPEGVDDLEALGGPDLVQPRPDVVEGGRHRGCGGGQGEIILEGDQQRRRAEDGYPRGEEPERG